MYGVSIAIQMTSIAYFDGVAKKVLNSVAYIMLAGPHERTMEEALNNLDEMLKLDARLLFLRYSLHIWNRLFLQTVQRRVCILQTVGSSHERSLCGVEVPVCWEEHLSFLISSNRSRKFYMHPSFIARQVVGIEVF